MIEVDTSAYESQHGERPKGRPYYWSFKFEGIDVAADADAAAAEVRKELAVFGDGAHVDTTMFGKHYPIFNASRYATFTAARKQARLFAKGIGAQRIIVCA